MRRLAWLGLLVLLVACTGTQSVQAPILLFVTHSEGGVHRAALIEDAQFSDPRFTYLQDTETVLAGAPVDFDVVDRAGSRSQIVLLLETGANDYQAAWFTTDGIVADTAAELAEARAATDLTGSLAGVLSDPADLCLTHIQTTHDGELLALLNEPGAGNCASSVASPSVFLVAADGEFIRELATSQSLLPSGLYIRQATGDQEDFLFVLDEGVGAARLNELELPDGALDAGTEFASGSDIPVPLDFGYTNGNFVVIQPDYLYVHGQARVSLSPSSGNNRLIADPYGDQLPALLVLRTGSSGQLHVAVAGAATETVTNLGNVSSGTVEPVQQWAYLLTTTGITTVDLMEIIEQFGNANPVSRATIPEIGAPGLITWFQGLLPEVP